MVRTRLVDKPRLTVQPDTWRQAPSHIMDQNLMDIIDAKMKLTIDNIE